MLNISTTDEWHEVHHGATIGLLELSGTYNTINSSSLGKRKKETEANLRERYQGYTRSDFLALPMMAAYERYYKRFDKTYHVLLQVESIVLNGKNLPNVSPLVDSNFIAEVETLVLTAGHDVTKLINPVSIDVSHKGVIMTQMNGTPKIIRPGDMIMRDACGICCSILYGQDSRSPITTTTKHVLYVAYAPNGVPIDSVETHLRKIEENVRSFSPLAVIEQCRVVSTN